MLLKTRLSHTRRSMAARPWDTGSRIQTRKNAYLIAKGWIEDHGWVALSLEDSILVSEETYQGKSEGRQYFEQALIDDEVFVFSHRRNMKRHNKPDAVNPAMALRLAIEDQRRRVTDPERSTKKYAPKRRFPEQSLTW